MYPVEILEKRKAGLITKQEGVDMVKAFLKKEFPEKQIASLIKDLCEANDTKFAAGAGFYESPNWTARREGLRDLMRQLGLVSGVMAGPQNSVPTKIQFNIITTGK